MSDKAWERCRLKYGEEADRRYKETSVKRAAIYLLLSFVSLIVLLVCELLN
jgi:hypothetical protein